MCHWGSSWRPSGCSPSGGPEPPASAQHGSHTGRQASASSKHSVFSLSISAAQCVGEIKLQKHVPGATASSQIRAESWLRGSKAAKCGVSFILRLGLGTGSVEKDSECILAPLLKPLSVPRCLPHGVGGGGSGPGISRRER